MEIWNLMDAETPGGALSPVVLATHDDARAILLRLDAGQELGEHQVRERAWLVVVDGTVQVADETAEPITAGAGSLLTFAPGERHTVSSAAGARLLLLLAPWPGDGHYTLGEKAEGERAESESVEEETAATAAG